MTRFLLCSLASVGLLGFGPLAGTAEAASPMTPVGSLADAVVADYDYEDYLDDLEDAREDYYDDLEDYYDDLNDNRRRALRRGYYVPRTTYVNPPVYHAPQVYRPAPVYHYPPVYHAPVYHQRVYTQPIYSAPVYTSPVYRTYRPINRGFVQVGRFGISF